MMEMKEPAGRTKKKVYSAPALEKGLEILELLAGEENGLSANKIANRLNRSVGTLFRMLMVLAQNGYVTTSPNSDAYFLTLKMFKLSHQFPPVRKLTIIATPIMRQLSYSIEQSCHLVIYFEGMGHIVVQQDSPSERIFSVRLGARAPLANSCSGHVLLAFAEDDERKFMLDNVPPGFGLPTKKDLDKLVRRVCGQGFERIESQQSQGVEDIGYPIFDYSGKMVAALVVPFVAHLNGGHPTNIKTAQERLKYAARQLSEALGYTLDLNEVFG